jgi:hypothetical protein
MEALIIEGNFRDFKLIENYFLNSIFFDSCQFYHASTIEEAKEILRIKNLNFLIIDPSFSKEYGLHFIKTVKNYSPSTKIIASSFCSIKPCKSRCGQQCLDLGADCRLDKMEGFNQLSETARELLGLVSYISYACISFLEGPSIGGSLKIPSFLRKRRRKRLLKFIT